MKNYDFKYFSFGNQNCSFFSDCIESIEKINKKYAMVISHNGAIEQRENQLDQKISSIIFFLGHLPYRILKLKFLHYKDLIRRLKKEIKKYLEKRFSSSVYIYAN